MTFFFDDALNRKSTKAADKISKPFAIPFNFFAELKR
jgi:hypothetical protein